jgi:hypothetical protein
MHLFNPDLFGGESPRTLEEWRAWWAKNETRFGPIPKPLADLQAENRAQAVKEPAVPKPPEAAKPTPALSSPETTPSAPSPRQQKKIARLPWLAPTALVTLAVGAAWIILRARRRSI